MLENYTNFVYNNMLQKCILLSLVRQKPPKNKSINSKERGQGYV